MEKQGVAYIKFVVTDKSKNFGIKSSKVVTLLVDEDAPVAEAWYIDRKLNGIRYSLKTLEELKAIDFDLQENKDAAQNVAFSIHSSFKDVMGIKPGSISIQIKDENQKTICVVPNSITNDYAPKFEITEEMLVAADSSLKSGIHYLQVWYNAEDVVTIPESNKAQDVQVEGGWFIWWPESDLPKITQKPAEDEVAKSILLNVSEAVTVTVFDDDAIKEAYCALLTESEYALIKDSYKTDPAKLIEVVPDAEKSARTVKSVPSTTKRDEVFSFVAPKSPQVMYLAYYVKDSGGKETINSHVVNVTDATSPILYIASPSNNEIPSVEMKNDNKNAFVTVTGQTIDTSGCTYLEFVWVPDVVETDNVKKSTLAKNFLNSLNTDGAHNTYAPKENDNVKVSEVSNLKVWSVKLGKEENTENGYKKQDFKFTMDLLNDFICNGNNEKNNNKFFVVQVTRKDGKNSVQEYKLSADNLPPVIKSITPETKTQIVESTKDYVLEFKAEKTNKVAIDTSEYAIYQSGTTPPKKLGSYDSSTKTYKYTIPKTTLEDWEKKTEKPVFIFAAADIFGNAVSSQYTLIISNLPQLKSITSPAPQNCKLGQPIQINANFSSAITLTEAELKDSYILLTNIENDSSKKECKAVYKSGAGSQTIIYEYIPVEGDYTDIDENVGVQYESVTKNEDGTETTYVNKLIQNCDKLKDGVNVHLNTLLSSSVLNGKQIKVDAVSPKVSSMSISAEKNYLKAGETVTVNVTFTEPILVQGSPKFVFDNMLELSLESSTSDTITFKGKVLINTKNGKLGYSNNCITEENIITDRYGNSLDISSISSDTTKYYVDTEKPKSPRLTDASGNDISSGEKNSVVSFKINKKENDDIVKFEYSLDGGTSWTEAVEGMLYEIKQDANLCARVTDRAGNISDSSSPIQLKIDGFPDFIVECTNTDGFYDVDQQINFKVTFDKSVIIESNNAKLTIGTNQDGTPCSITTMTTYSDETSEVFFTYIVKQGDEFTIDVTNVDFGESIKNRLGFKQDGKQPKNECVRSGVRCDTLAPTATMIPGTVKENGSVDYKINESNVYSKGNKIKITFSEPVQKGRGNIILRQTAGWAIPPVLTAEEFNIICNQLNDTQKNILALRNPDGTLMEDVEDLHLHVAYRNDKYHGTGQFIGPYKKTTYGVKQSGNEYVPNVDTSFVLDFDMDIDDTFGTPKAFGTTFRKSDGTLKNYNFKNRDNVVSKYYFANQVSYEETILASPLDTPNDAKNISVNDIRTVLETAGVHKRELDVTSPNVEIDGSVVTITFPKGLIDKDESLPKGRKWELVIEEGAFLDMAGKSFGEDNNDDLKKEIVISIKNNNTENNNEFFYSAGVATPVIRVDRYSYGLGIKQSDGKGNQTAAITSDSTSPTGYVRVRIDCETPDATIKYAKQDYTSSTPAKDTSTGTDSNYCTSNKTTTNNLTTSKLEGISPSSPYTKNTSFAGGNSSLTSSLKQYIIAQATKDNLGKSEKGVEGIFKTVVHFVTPKSANGTEEAKHGEFHADWSIRGTTNKYSEPSISPFPLRDTPCGSPYLRRTYKSGSDYYWVSFEILIDSTFSGHGWATSNTKLPGDSGAGWYNWAKNWGLMWPGELTECVGMQNWE